MKSNVPAGAFQSETKPPIHCECGSTVRRLEWLPPEEHPENRLLCGVCSEELATISIRCSTLIDAGELHDQSNPVLGDRFEYLGFMQFGDGGWHPLALAGTEHECWEAMLCLPYDGPILIQPVEPVARGARK